MQIKFSNIHQIKIANPNKKIVFCSGTFDLLHIGHVLFLEESKQLADILVVGVGDDRTIKHYKGDSRPIFNEKIRLRLINSIKFVDYCYIDRPNFSKDLVLTNEKIFKKLKPDIWSVNDDAFNLEYRKKIAAKYSIKLKILKRKNALYPNLSTSLIIEKICHDYQKI